MRKIICLSFMFVFCIFFCNSYVFADEVECEYHNSLGNYSIIYDNTDKPKIKNNELIHIFRADSLFGLYEYNSDNIVKVDLNVDQDYNVAVYGKEKCPNNMRVCRYVSFSVGSDSIVHKGLELLTSGNLNSLTTDVSVLDIHNDFYFYNEDSFNNSKFKRYYNKVLCRAGFNGQVIEDVTEWCKSVSGNVDFSDIICNVGSNVLVNNPFISIAAASIEAVGNRIEVVGCNTLLCTDQSYTGEYDTFDVNCGTLENLKTSFINSINEYKSCGSDKNCKMNRSRDVDIIENRAKSYCGSVVKNYSYTELQSDCLNACFSLKKDLNSLKRGTDLYHGITSSSKTCSVSDRIINWLSNIFRWGKFIAPVLVIILSMLDFIKAIASQSEDEMKKVQGRFVNRLITAALVFLLPFILEFILRAFNLLSDNPYCNLI